MIKEVNSLIPTNIITGFLGVGKTTVIQYLLSQRPEDERWAVLVNEFGEVGIDGNLFSHAKGNQSGVTISQVPGGCMCCANGLPMQMALNLLLAKSKPHRLLIEPTGLGHPKEVIGILSGEHYEKVLDLQATLSLVDARKVRDDRYTSNSTFNQQIEIAEVVVANKADLYQAADFPELLSYVDDKFGLENKLVYQVQHGEVNLDWLSHPASDENRIAYKQFNTNSQPSELPMPLETPKEGYVCAENTGEGFFSRGWIFNPHWKFDIEKLRFLIHGLQAERVKGIFMTQSGFAGFNKVDSVVTQIDLKSIESSRVEIIGSSLEAVEGIEEALLDCLINRNASQTYTSESLPKRHSESVSKSL